MNGKIRRVITGHDASGKAVVLEDRDAPAVRTNPHRPGHVSTDLWKTTSTPVIVKRAEPDPTEGPKQIHPLPGGTVFRISEIAPETEAIRNIDPEKAKEVFKAMGAENASTFGQNKRHPYMHRTETIDYGIVLEGEIVLILDDGETIVRAGDIVVQRGTAHAWANRSGSNTRIAFILIDGRFEEGLGG